MDILWGVGQEGRIAQARARATQPGARPMDVAEYASLLETRLDRLALVCRALWSYLQEATQLSEEELLERVKQLDLADGKLDGKVSAAVVECPSCHRTMSPKHGRCMWCGEENPQKSAFDQI
jgi:hypothetical protein